MMKTPCQLMAETAIKNKTPHYHGATLLKSEDLSFLDNYKGKKGFFIKKFLINDKFNLNRWRVTWDAMKQDIWGFIGKPLVLTPDKDHPPVTYQEDYRVGNIIDVGLDEITHTAWQVSEVFDEEAQKKILDGEVEFGSPTVLIYSEDTREQRFAGTEQQEDILHRFRPAHDALVENPAYGENVDHIPAVCTGDGVGCGLKLLEVSASVEYRKRYESAIEKEIYTYTKDEMGYVNIPPSGPRCGLCKWRVEPNACGLVEGKIDMEIGCCNAFLLDASTNPKSADIGDNNTTQMSIIPFVQETLRKRFSQVELANIVGNIMSAREGADDSCVSKHIRHQMDSHPNMPHDKAIAIAYSECGEGGSLDAKIENLFMPKLADELLKYHKN